MRIGIITFWWSNNNYGQALQCYALQKYLRDLGHDVFLIRYNYNSDLKKRLNINLKRLLKIFNPYLLIRYIIRNLYLPKQSVIIEEPDRNFDCFRQKYLKQTEKIYDSFKELFLNPPEMDACIVGSDQVWNYNYIDIPRSNPYRVYFLDFCKGQTKRFAYAASWGVLELPEKVKNAVKPLLAKFDYIGVREESGLDLCRQCGRNDADLVCDPTLLLTADDYRAIYFENYIRKPVGKFIFLYMLNGSSDFNIQSVYNFASEKDLHVVYVSANGLVDERKKDFATIPEWLWLVDHAEYVITNSYHCGVFSTIFHKSFGIVPRSGKFDGMNTRFETLFNLLGIDYRFIINDDFSILNMDYEVKKIAISKEFLRILKM